MQTIILYLDGFLDTKECLKRLLSQKLKDQYTFKTEKVNQNLGQAISTTQNIQESNAKLNENHRKMLADYKKLYETLSAIQEKIHSEVTLYSDELKTQFLQLLASYSEQTREILKDQNAQLLEERKTTLDDYQKIDENISSILETVNKNLSDYSATVEKTLISTLEEYNKTAQKVTESFFGEGK